MMKTPIRFGLIGVGGIGAYHRAAIEALASKGLARLIAVADPTAQKLAAEKAELEARGVRWHLNYRDMLRDETDLDAVVIATPIPFHYEMAKACIERGLFVHLEKPPVPLMKQLDELIAADVKGSVSVGFQMIVSRCIQSLKELIVGGKLGQVREIRAGACWSRRDSYYARASWAGKMTLNGSPVFDGPATNALAHLIHNIMYLAANGRNEFAVPSEVKGELYRARPIESYDTACLRGQFPSGIEFSVALTHVTKEWMPFCIEVRGTEGSARLDKDGAILETTVGVSCDHAETTQQLLDENYSNFVDVLQGKSDRFSTRLSDTTGYVSTTNAMLLSSDGIHNIEPAFFQKYTQDNDEGYDVFDLRKAVEKTVATGQLFSEQGCPWATAKPKAIQLPLGSAVDSLPFLSA